MGLELTAAMFVTLLVAAWRLLRRQSGYEAGAGPLPNVGDAPNDAEPIGTVGLVDNGLGMYALTLHRRPRAPGPVSDD